MCSANGNPNACTHQRFNLIQSKIQRHINSFCPIFHRPNFCITIKQIMIEICGIPTWKQNEFSMNIEKSKKMVQFVQGSKTFFDLGMYSLLSTYIGIWQHYLAAILITQLTLTAKPMMNDYAEQRAVLLDVYIHIVFIYRCHLDYHVTFNNTLDNHMDRFSTSLVLTKYCGR